MKHLILACLFFGSAYSYEARLFGQFGIANTLINTKTKTIPGFEWLGLYDYSKIRLKQNAIFKFGYEQNITDHHILQVYYPITISYVLGPNPADPFLGLNYIYEFPLRYGFLGFYGGFDLGVISPGDIVDENTFGSHLNIGTRYRIKAAFIELGLNTAFIKAKRQNSSTRTRTETYPFSFMFSMGIMFNL